MAIKLTEIKKQAGVTAPSHHPSSIAPKTEVELVRDSFADLSKHGETLAARFYERFFQHYPEIKPLFDGVSTQGQQKKFLASLVLVMQSLDQKDVVDEYLLGLGSRHIHYGVKKKHYSMIVENLLAVFAEFSGEKWTAQLSQAWENTFNRIISVMQNAYAENNTSEPLKVSSEKQRPQTRADAVLNGLKVAVIMIDRDGNITFVNRSAREKLTQCRVELKQLFPRLDIDQLVGRNINDFPKTIAVRWASLSAPERLPYKTELELGSLHGELALTAVLDDQGKYLGTAIDWEDKPDIENIVTAENYDSSDERMAALLESFEVMPANELKQIAQKLTELDQADMMVRDMPEAYTENTTNLADGMENQRTLLQNSHTELETLTEHLKQSVAKIEAVKQRSDEIVEQTENSSLVITQLVEAMSTMNASVQMMSKLIADTEQMAFQTNLLGLNAAVEASHAGEKGHGMAVIATEIRSLAKQTTAQLREAKALINANDDIATQSSQLIDQSGHTRQTMVTSAEVVNELVADILSVANEQSQKIELINKAFVKMNDLTKTNADIIKQLSHTDKS